MTKTDSLILKKGIIVSSTDRFEKQITWQMKKMHRKGIPCGRSILPCLNRHIHVWLAACCISRIVGGG